MPDSRWRMRAERETNLSEHPAKGHTISRGRWVDELRCWRISGGVSNRVREMDMKHKGGTYGVEVARTLEHPPALDAIMMRLAIMLMQTDVVDEYLAARSAVRMTIVVVLYQFLLVVEVLVTALTIVVTTALHPVLLQPEPGRKIELAVVAEVVRSRVLFVLLEGTPVREGSIAAVTVRHRIMLCSPSIHASNSRRMDIQCLQSEDTDNARDL